ncbi:hypothetical protein F5Y17DRAFT_449947 [Xylariaceae sp. FL0594]|nr:hypothetical protein F5Y17DRAFT_449947 [Xylariaceae sp. FL0594]
MVWHVTPVHVRDKLPNNADDPRQDDIALLLRALIASPAAFSIPSPNGSCNVAFNLMSILQRVKEDGLNLDQFRHLVHCVVDRSPDMTASSWSSSLSTRMRSWPRSVKM